MNRDLQKLVDEVRELKNYDPVEEEHQKLLRRTMIPENDLLTRHEISEAIRQQQTDRSKEISDLLQISILEREKDQLILEILRHPEFAKMIEEGKITYAMIKPEANKAKEENEKFSDDEVADHVKAEIKAPLEIVFSKNFAMTVEDAREFYANLADRPELLAMYSKWMASGAITALVLYNPNGNAVVEWRTQMGPTNPQKPDSEGRTDRIRHRYAKGIDNNVTHGSDSIESVKREIAWFLRKLEKFGKKREEV